MAKRTISQSMTGELVVMNTNETEPHRLRSCGARERRRGASDAGPPRGLLRNAT